MNNYQLINAHTDNGAYFIYFEHNINLKHCIIN
jgi:hypothetical protein